MKDTNFVRQHSAINWIIQQLPKKNAEFADIISQYSAAAQPAEKKMTPEEEREMRYTIPSARHSFLVPFAAFEQSAPSYSPVCRIEHGVKSPQAVFDLPP